MPSDTLDPKHDKQRVDPDKLLDGVCAITYRAESIVALLKREGIPLSPVTFAALGLVHDALSDLIAEEDGEE